MLLIYIWILLGVIGFIIACKSGIFYEIEKEANNLIRKGTYFCLLIILTLLGPISFITAILHLYKEKE